MRRAFSQILSIARRELLSYFLSPLAYVVWVAFLLLNGYIFFAIVRFLSDPLGPGGSPMQLFFGGSLLYWFVQIFFMSTITMRLFAEEARSGTLETLLVTPTSEGALVLGKYLGALVFYLFLWLPTFLYVAIILAVSDAPQDLGPVFSGYLGTFLLGAFFLALGLFASALTKNQLISAILSILFSSVFVLVGIFKSTIVSQEWRALFAYLDLFGHMSRFGRGVVDSRPVVYSLTGALFFLFLATQALLLRRLWGAVSWSSLRGLFSSFGAGLLRNSPPRSGVRALLGVVGVVAALFLVVGLNVLASRSPKRWDWTYNNFYSLSSEGEAIVQSLPSPVEVIVFLTEDDPQFGAFFSDVTELLGQLESKSQGRLTVEYVDPWRDRTRAELLYQKYNLPVDQELNLIVFANPSQESTKYVYGEEMADFEEDDTGAHLTRFRGEEAFLSALLTISEAKKPKVYFTTGHGEAPLEAGNQRSITEIFATLEEDNVTVERFSFDATKAIPKDADALLVIGPTEAFQEEEAKRLEDYLSQGGSILFALDPTPANNQNGIAPTGLQRLLARWNAPIDDTIVFDPSLEGHASADDSVYSYALLLAKPSEDHQISRGVRSLRVAIAGARSVKAVEAAGYRASSLLETSPEAWGEKNFLPEILPAKEPADLSGPLSVAVASEDVENKGRLIVVGSSSFLMDVYLGPPGARNPGNFQFALRSIRWLLSRDHLVDLPSKAPLQTRLQLSASNTRVILWLLMGGIPLLGVILGFGVWHARRR